MNWVTHMLSNIDLNQRYDKQTYSAEMKALEERLVILQEELKKYGIPVVMVFDGWSAAGKGTLIARITDPLDPRYFNVYAMNKMTEEKKLHPFLWPFWTKLPAKGRITIFDKSWHRLILAEHTHEDEKWYRLSAKEKNGFYYDINAFEELLSDDGIVLLKFFLHISKDEQKSRLKQLEKNPATKWRVTDSDYEQNKSYKKYADLFSELIQRTDTDQNRWHIIEADDWRYATIKLYKTIICRIEEEIAKEIERRAQRETVQSESVNINILSAVNPDRDISDSEYKHRLSKLQAKLSEQASRNYTLRRPIVVVYEGWDASGKGGNIKRLTAKLDPRSYEVVPIAAPTAEELAHHYLWRFYTKVPKDGHFAIFDRSWYGRVLVERVEKLTPVDVWMRAYKEMNDFELHLANHGTIIFKFWMHIDKDEQLRRFTERQNNPLKQHKITDEDWRNREKWDQYATAVDDMLFRTNTAYAPWIIIEANNKKYARLKTLEIITNELDIRLK